MKFSNFFSTKDGMIEPTCEKFNRWKQNGVPVEFVRCDNAGENKKLHAVANGKDWKLNIEFEFTGRDTPQFNHLAELGFTVLASRGRAMMAAANVPLKIRYKVWKEAFKTATLLDGLVVIELDGLLKTRYEHWSGQLPAFAKHLRTWGEAGTVKTKTPTTPRVHNRGEQCMFIGYATNHAGDCYSMWNVRTNGVHESRDVTWLKRMYFEKTSGVQDIVVLPEFDSALEVKTPHTRIQEGTGTVIPVEVTAGLESAPNPPPPVATVAPPPVVTRAGRVSIPNPRYAQEMAGFSYNIHLSAAEEKYYTTMKEFGLVGAGLGGGFEHTEELKPMKYKQAMKVDPVGWTKSVEQEHQRMEHNNVFQEVLRKDVPANAKILSSTWAMKKKANGDLRARINARGYEQVDGEHYDKDTKAAPVVCNTTIRILLILTIMAKWASKILDVNGAFLKGQFKDNEKVYMEVPEGFAKFYGKNTVLLLLRTIYGLIQAAYAFWRELLEAFHSMGFSRSKADPCLYYAWTENGLILWVSWVDDCITCGNADGVRISRKQMMERFECEDVGEMTEYLGCKITCDNTSMKITQPVLLQSFADEFDIPTDGTNPNTPAIPGDVLVKGDPVNYIPDAEQRKYRSGVGKLIHMTQWSRPDIQNSVRELSRFMSGSVLAQRKAMYRAMRYCLNTPNRGLLLKPTGTWDGNPNFEFTIRGKSDSDYAKDPTTRRSVGGRFVYLQDAPIVTVSRMQGCVTLSATEAELVEATNCAQDMLFAMRVLESIGLKVKKPMYLETDNKGAKDLTHNWSVGGRTRHIDVRYMFLRELKEQNLIVTRWTSTKTNEADMYTKNLAGPLFERHIVPAVGYDEYMTEHNDSRVEGVTSA